jgi:hypothetical protein
MRKWDYREGNRLDGKAVQSESGGGLREWARIDELDDG